MNSDGEKHAGGCACGAVRYACHGQPLRVTICHCTWCQRRTGTAFAAEAVFNQENIIVTGKTSIYRHTSDGSGRWLDVEFCPVCGTSIGFTLEAVPGIRTIAAGTFDQAGWISADTQKFRHVFTRSRRSWSDIPDGVECHEEHFRP